MHRWCAIIDPAVISTPRYGQGILIWSLTQYEYPTPVHFRVLASSDISSHSDPSWHVIVHDVGDVGCEAIRSEEANQDVHRVLQPVSVL